MVLCCEVNAWIGISVNESYELQWHGLVMVRHALKCINNKLTLHLMYFICIFIYIQSCYIKVSKVNYDSQSSFLCIIIFMLEVRGLKCWRVSSIYHL